MNVTQEFSPERLVIGACRVNHVLLPLLVSWKTLFLSAVMFGCGVFLICYGLGCLFNARRREDYPGQRCVAVLSGLGGVGLAVGMALRETGSVLSEEVEPFLPNDWNDGIGAWIGLMMGIWMINVGVKPWFDDTCKPLFPGDKYVGVPVGLLQMMLGIWLWTR